MRDIKSSEGRCFVIELYLFIPGMKSSKFLTLAILRVSIFDSTHEETRNDKCIHSLEN